MARGIKGSAMPVEERRRRKREAMAAFRAKDPDGYRAYYRKWSQKYYTKDRPRYLTYARKGRLKAKFGLSLEQYDAMFANQGGVCAMCANPPKKYRLAVDHCHKTGKVRALLCQRCNTGLGRIEDEEFMTRAEAYLRAHRG